MYGCITSLQSSLDQIKRIAYYDAGGSADVAGPEVCGHVASDIA
jgi:hypothetical protein